MKKTGTPGKGVAPLIVATVFLIAGSVHADPGRKSSLADIITPASFSEAEAAARYLGAALLAPDPSKVKPDASGSRLMQKPRLIKVNIDTKGQSTLTFSVETRKRIAGKGSGPAAVKVVEVTKLRRRGYVPKVGRPYYNRVVTPPPPGSRR